MIHLTTEQFLTGYLLGALAGAGVFLHADRNGSRHATAWACAVFLVIYLALPLYLIHVYRLRRRAQR
jgi:hypothetical protein